MGLFSRKNTRSGRPAPTFAPVAASAPVYQPGPVTAADLDRVMVLLGRFEAAVGNDAATRAAVLALSEAGGALSAEDAVRLTSKTGDTGVDRPWHWFVAVAEAAQREQRIDVLAHLAGFVTMWSVMFAPNLGLADELDMKLSTAPERLLARLYSIILVEVRKLDPAIVVVDDPEQVVTVDTVLNTTSFAATKINMALLDDDALAVVRSRT